MYKKETAAVVVTYNRKEKLINCIESLLRQTPEKPEITNNLPFFIIHTLLFYILYLFSDFFNVSF